MAKRLLDHSPDNKLISNNLTNNQQGLEVAGVSLSDFMQDIDTSNIVDGKTMHYIINSTNLTVNPSTYPNIGYLALVNCKNITVDSLLLQHNGMLTAFTQNSSITQNTITNGSITLDHSSAINLTLNAITGGEIGLILFNSENNRVTRNVVTKCTDWGVQLESSSNNTISDNNVKNNTAGIELTGSSNNTAFRNNIADNKNYGLLLGDSFHNLFYHNNFTNPIPYQVISSQPPFSGNYFDDGYSSGGNYWIDYHGTDQHSGPKQNMTGSDGIGDTRYTNFFGVLDKYPLMQPIQTFTAGVWQGKTRNVELLSNSTLSDFAFNMTARTISFNVTGMEGSRGFCRITIPNSIVQSQWSSGYSVMINGTRWPFRNWTDTENAYIYVNYTQSTQRIVIVPVPEFPEAIMIAIMVIPVTLAVTATKKLKRTKVDQTCQKQYAVHLIYDDVSCGRST